jgi:putative transposase
VELRYRYRIHPTEVAVVHLTRTFAHCRVVWNWAVGRSKDLWREGERISYRALDLELTDLRGTESSRWLRETSCVPQQQVLRDFQKARRAWWDKKNPAGRPRFKNKRKHPVRSARYTRSGFDLKNGRLVLGLVANPIEVRWTRPLPSPPTSVTVYVDTVGRWWASFVVEVPAQQLLVTGLQTGVDLGVGNRLWTTDNGQVVANPRRLRNREKYLRRCQRALARKNDGSKNKAKAQVRVTRAHAKIADQRRDLLHKETTKLVKGNDRIATQADSPKSWAKRAKGGQRRLGKSVADAAPGTIRRMIGYKTRLYGREHTECSQWEPTTQTCSTCGAKTKLSLSQRLWTCEHCDTGHDRDRNAAINIRTASIGGPCLDVKQCKTGYPVRARQLLVEEPSGATPRIPRL